MKTDNQVHQVMILSEIQVMISRLVHDEKKFNDLNDRINEVKSMILDSPMGITGHIQDKTTPEWVQ